MDNTKVYTEQIEPLLEKIAKIAEENKIAFFASFQTMEAYNGKGKWDCTIQGRENVKRDTRGQFLHPDIVLAATIRNIPQKAKGGIVAHFDPEWHSELVKEDEEFNAKLTQH